MSLGKALLSIARFALKKIVKPAAEEYGPDILADVVRGREKRAPDARRDDDKLRQEPALDSARGIESQDMADPRRQS